MDQPKPKSANISIKVNLERNEIEYVRMDMAVDPLIIATIGAQITLRCMKEYQDQSKGKSTILHAVPNLGGDNGK